MMKENERSPWQWCDGRSRVFLGKHAGGIYFLWYIFTFFIKTAKEGGDSRAVEYLAARKNEALAVYKLARADVENADGASLFACVPRDDIALCVGRGNDLLLFAKAVYGFYSVAVFRRRFEHKVFRGIVHFFS